jgi:hypothetical protein
VPSLLMPELGGRTLRDLQRLHLIGSEVVNSTDCHVVEGVYPDLSDCLEQLWIAKRAPFLARVVTEVPRGGIERDVRVRVLRKGRLATQLKLGRAAALSLGRPSSVPFRNRLPGRGNYPRG